MHRELPLEAGIRAALSPFSQVKAAYLFGSRARGTARADSDLDVAVSIAPEVDGTRRAELMLDLLAALARELGALGERVDLLDLDRASSSVAFRVIREGRRVFSREEAHRVRLEAWIARRYDDERPYRELFRGAARAAAARMGGADG